MVPSADVGCRVEVQLELLMPVTVSAIMPLSWDFSACWFALFGSVDQRLQEQRRNRRLVGL